MNSKDSKTSDSHILLNVSDKINLKRSDKYVALFMCSICYTWKKYKKVKYSQIYKNNKCKISAPTYNYKFELPDISYSVSDIQDYVEYLIKHEPLTDIPQMKIHVKDVESHLKLE